MTGGKFLERGRVKKPNQPNFSTQTTEYYTAQDLYVGASLVINNHGFLLIDSDDYAYNYMEGHSDEAGAPGCGLPEDSMPGPEATPTGRPY